MTHAKDEEKMADPQFRQDMAQKIFKGIVEQDMEAIFLPVEHIDGWLTKFKSWRHFIIDSYHFRLIEMIEAIDSLAFMKMH